MKQIITILLLVCSAHNAFAVHTDTELESYLSAAENGKIKLFKTLDQDFGDTVLRAMALDEAVSNKQISILNYLIENYEFSEETLGMALHTAAKVGSKDCVKKLLGKGALINYKIQSQTPIMVAKNAKNLAIVKILEGLGADTSMFHDHAKSSSFYDYLPTWQTAAATSITLLAVLGIKILVEQHINTWRYGLCTICQEDIVGFTEQHVFLSCGHHFHLNCLIALRDNIREDMQKFNSWIQNLRAINLNLNPVLQWINYIHALHQLNEYTAEIYRNTLIKGIWSGATLKCPTCRAPISG